MSNKESMKSLEGMPLVEDHQHLTVEKIKEYLPRGSSTRVTQEIVDMIHRAESETGVSQELLEEQLLSYMHLLKGSVGIEKLVNAIKFCNLRMLPSMGGAKAYKIVFPAKAAQIEGRGETVDSFASMYNGTKLVTEINKLLIVPAYVTYQPMHHAAIKKQFDLMNGIGARADDRVSPTVQQKAAETLAMLTKMPEENSIELKMGLSEGASGVVQGLFEQVSAMAKLQKARSEAGESISSVQVTGINTDRIIDVEVDE